MSPYRLTVLFAAVLVSSCGLGVKDISSHAGDGGLCSPTGRSLVDTGVYIGPGACSTVTLYALQDQNPTAWVLAVAWPMRGEHHYLKVENLTTGGHETKLIYTGDPEWKLYSGDYYLGGLEMAAGANALHYKVWDAVPGDGGYVDKIIDEGELTLQVELSSSTGS
ncbi:MAG: hypothetical protein QM765_50250 [Myxococcales bacterium]